jgi:hypothetical protein
MRWVVFGRSGCPYSEHAATKAALAFLKPYNSTREKRLFECVECAYRDDQPKALQLFLQECGKINVTNIQNTTHSSYSTVPLCFKLEGTQLTFVGGSSEMGSN